MLKLPLWGLFTGLGYWLWRFFAPQHSDLALENKVVIVTGASSGIGRALAMAFARRGTRVILTARRRDLLEEVYREIEPYAAAIHIIPADLTNPADRAALITETLDTFGQIDVLVNNAGISGGGLFEDIDPARIDTTITLNLLAPIQLTRQVLPHMLKQGSGAIINVASTAGRVASPTFVTYSASKHGLAAFSDGLRREIQGRGVHILLALPGWTRTDMVPAEVVEQLKPRGFELQEPADIAEQIVAGLVQGREELILGNWLLKGGVLAERYVPLLHRLYWRVALTRAWVDATRKIP